MGYKEMYLKLFNAVTDTINNLQAAQQETEEMFVEQEGLAVIPLDGAKEEE